MRIFVDLRQPDIYMMRDVRDLHARHPTCSPKKKHVIGRFLTRPQYNNARAENTFRKLVLIDLIEHSHNGHCWLSHKGAQALLAAK